MPSQQGDQTQDVGFGVNGSDKFKKLRITIISPACAVFSKKIRKSVFNEDSVVYKALQQLGKIHLIQATGIFRRTPQHNAGNKPPGHTQ